MKNNLPPLIHFAPNLRSEAAAATTGYTWGKPVVNSHIIKILHSAGVDISSLQLSDQDIVAERWLCSDDRALGSRVVGEWAQGQEMPFFELLEQSGERILGAEHWTEFGPYLQSIMKQLDTNAVPSKGSLSVQVHPKPGHPTRPAKPEMWRGRGQIYLGWNHDVTEAEIRAAYEAGTLEQLMNAMQLTPDKLVLVQGGMIHAIRYDTFTAEWSMAPGAEDIKKGNLKDATVSPYDRTDGKTPRPGKEDLEATLELLRSYEDGFAGHKPSSLFTQPEELFTQPQEVMTEGENKITALFRTPEVFVNQLDVVTHLKLDATKRGFPLYVESGTVEVQVQGEKVDQLRAGQEVFVCANPSTVALVATSGQPARVIQWYTPFKEEKN